MHSHHRFYIRSFKISLQAIWGGLKMNNLVQICRSALKSGNI